MRYVALAGCGIAALALGVAGCGGGGEAAPAVDADLAARGASLFQEHACGTCHWTEPPPPSNTIPPIGPPLYGLFGTQERLQSGETITVDEAYVKESILDPDAKTPEGYYAQMVLMKEVTPEEADALTEYIKSLKDVAPRYEAP